jgi:sporulation protein YlmC with PRC-barrel domain
MTLATFLAAEPHPAASYAAYFIRLLAIYFAGALLGLFLFSAGAIIYVYLAPPTPIETIGTRGGAVVSPFTDPIKPAPYKDVPDDTSKEGPLDGQDPPIAPGVADAPLAPIRNAPTRVENQMGTRFVQRQASDQILASKFKGTDVVGINDENIGNVSDILFDRNNRVLAYVIGIGRFLGIGSKDAAIAPSSFQSVPGRDASDFKLRLSMTKNELRAAPAFEPVVPPRPIHNQKAPVRPLGEPAPISPPSRSTQEVTPPPFSELAPVSPLSPSIREATPPPSTRKSKPLPSNEPAVAAPVGAQIGNAFVQKQGRDEWLASKFKGTDVIGTDEKKIGDVSDILFDKDKKVLAYIVGVGGFLGIGSKDVAIDPASFQMVPGKDQNDFKLRLSMIKEELKAAPAFEPYQPPRPVSSQNAPTRPMGSPAPTTPSVKQ